MRILGLFFDPKLSWKEHTNQNINRVKHKLYQLQRIANSKHFNLAPKTVWKLYLSTIRPVIEYGLGIYENASNFHQLESLQQRAARIALRSHRSTNYKYNYLLLNAQSLELRKDIVRAKLWVKLTRSHPTLMVHQYYQNWRNFAQNNQSNYSQIQTRSMTLQENAIYAKS